jgi:hypothetical protein
MFGDVKRKGGSYPAGYPDNDLDEHGKEVKWLVSKLAPRQTDAAGRVTRPAVCLLLQLLRPVGPRRVGLRAHGHRRLQQLRSPHGEETSMARVQRRGESSSSLTRRPNQTRGLGGYTTPPNLNGRDR